MFESMELMIAMIAVAAFMCGLLTALAVIGLVWCFRVTHILTKLEAADTAAAAGAPAVTAPVDASHRWRDRSSGESMPSYVSNLNGYDPVSDGHRVVHHNDRYHNPPAAVATDYLSHSAFVDIEKQMDQYRANRQNNALLVHSDAPPQLR